MKRFYLLFFFATYHTIYQYVLENVRRFNYWSQIFWEKSIRGSFSYYYLISLSLIWKIISFKVWFYFQISFIAREYQQQFSWSMDDYHSNELTYSFESNNKFVSHFSEIIFLCSSLSNFSIQELFWKCKRTLIINIQE